MSIATKVTAGGAAPDQTLKNFGSTAPVSVAAGNVVVNVYTPASGKTFYITDLFISGDFATKEEFQIIIGGVVALDFFFKPDTAPINWPGIETQWAVPGGSQLQLKFVTATASGNVTWGVSGFEQNT